jgi:hypothetical protein
MSELEALKMGIRASASSKSLIAALCLAALGTSASSQDAPKPLCVTDVPFSEPVPVAISQVYAAPDTVRDVSNRLAPLVYGSGKMPTDAEGKYHLKKIYWPLNDGAPGFGKAYALEPSLELNDGKVASDGEKTVIAISGVYQDTAGKRVEKYESGLVWKTRLFASTAGGKFVPMPLFEDQIENPSSIKWDAATNRFILEVFELDTSNPERNSGSAKYYSLANGQLAPMNDKVPSLFTLPFGSDGAFLELYHGALAYRSAHGVQSVIADGLLQSFDFGGWTGLFPIGDPGWYLAAGNDTATAFELDVSSSPPRVIRKVMFRGHQGLFGEIITWLFGFDGDRKERFSVDSIVADYPPLSDGTCFRFSNVANRLFRCDGKMHVRKTVEQIGNTPTSDDFRFEGDASSISAAILISSSGAVKTQNTSGLQNIDLKLTARPFSLLDFPDLKRSFIADSGSVYEIVNDGERPKAVRIGFGKEGEWFFVSALQIGKSSEPVFFTRSGIFRIVDGTLQPYWKPPYGQIMITGGAVPTAVGKWEGILFALGDGFKVSGFKLLTGNTAYCATGQ